MQPIIRLKIDYSGGFSVVRSDDVLKHLEGALANKGNFLHFYKRKDMEKIINKEKRKGVDGPAQIYATRSRRSSDID